MQFETRNPASGELLTQFDFLSDSQLEQHLSEAELVATTWRKTSFSERASLLNAIASQLKQQSQFLAETISLETGKLLSEAYAEVEKCALVCRYYAANAQQMLEPKLIQTTAQRSLVSYYPWGVVLAIMPWNFPLWQVFRCLAPALMSGNALLLKHAPNVPRCARAIEKVIRDAGAPLGLMTDLTISVEQTSQVIADERVKAISFTGSEVAGRKIASLAGLHLKPAILELGGSDPFIVLDDADMSKVIDAAMLARFSNAGQVCIADKTFFSGFQSPSRIYHFIIRKSESIRNR
ncbi:aldehyde dehydrogenase family protein [Psychromonas sp. KJ10-10]|uniref:aldehyde dehydrogenase family protein n=1 Tax=Psychromonas sp. KJ10-10 TaxID=3391823 RepID=UPI0039B383BA